MNLWYLTLNKPLFTPPQSYFPIAWSVLYLLMAVSIILVLIKPNSKTKFYAVTFFTIQLFFNYLWTYLFFELHSTKYALIDLLCILIFLTLTMIIFFKLSKPAFFLLIPYLLQIFFAIYLTVGIAILN
ncbi:tryptophan-rich sensory protein [bacterium]|nr:tryptophan-rich sensory protein [bacterium]